LKTKHAVFSVVGFDYSTAISIVSACCSGIGLGDLQRSLLVWTSPWFYGCSHFRFM